MACKWNPGNRVKCLAQGHSDTGSAGIWPSNQSIFLWTSLSKLQTRCQFLDSYSLVFFVQLLKACFYGIICLQRRNENLWKGDGNKAWICQASNENCSSKQSIFLVSRFMMIWIIGILCKFNKNCLFSWTLCAWYSGRIASQQATLPPQAIWKQSK